MCRRDTGTLSRITEVPRVRQCIAIGITLGPLALKLTVKGVIPDDGAAVAEATGLRLPPVETNVIREMVPEA